MFNAIVIETFIASPSDVNEERKIIRQVIEEWNVVNSKKLGIMLKSLGWEKDVYSSFSEGNAQEAINKQILSDADLLIGVFWTRVGTPTDGYLSGTVEEIQKHINANKPLLLFFSEEDIPRKLLDYSQNENLDKFRNWCKDNGLFYSYKSKTEFEEQLRRQLGLLINQDEKMIELIKQYKNDDYVTVETENNYLSEYALSLLKEISQDKSGCLLTVRTLGGPTAQTNGKGFGSSHGNPREEAKIISAIEELENFGLIKATSYKREIFKITDKGYEIADKIESN